jgi:phosphatidylglycerol---prolipoprotein diacylglyceryl transferase
LSFTWSINPELFRFGPLAVRYYGLLFVGVFLGSFSLLKWQMERVGWTEEEVGDFIIPGMLAVILGSRFGHVFFYEPGYYLSNPVEIIKFWKGGLASHGATLGIMLGVIYFAKKIKMAVLEFGDRLSFAAALGSSLVRIGNFFNSEIVGRTTNGSWGVKFPLCHEDRGKALAEIPLRHPSQIYEAIMGATVLLILYLVDRKFKEKRPRGLLAALFMSLYFTGRFFVEFFKEFQTGLRDTRVLTMGQYLSIPLAILGYVGIYLAIKYNLPSVSVDPASIRKKSVKTGKNERKNSKSKVKRKNRKKGKK